MLLVTGATGNVGRELVRALDGVPFRTLSRRPAARSGGAVEHVVADLADPTTLTAAFAGVERLFLLTPGTGVGQTVNALTAARQAGVRHVVHLSSINVLGDPMPAMGRWHHDREELVRACGIPATILRPGGFMTNALEWVPTIRDGGYVLDPIGPGRHAPIDPADIADVAVTVLKAEDPADKEYVLTGGEALTVADQVRILAATVGRDIEVRAAATPAEAVRSRFPQGAPAHLADAITEGFALMRADTVGFRTDTVHRLTGHAPRSFASWCARNAGAFTRPPAGISR